MKRLKVLQIRGRLLRKAFFGLRWNWFLAQAKPWIQEVICDGDNEIMNLNIPMIALLSSSLPQNFLVLSYLLKDRRLSFIAPKNFAKDPIIKRLSKVQDIMFSEDYAQVFPYRLFKKVATILRDFNRSIVIDPSVFQKYYGVGTVVLPRIAMVTNAPIVPIILNWHPPTAVSSQGVNSNCVVKLGKKIYLSPRSAEFQDIFFRRRGMRKFRDLNKDELKEITERILAKLHTSL